MRVAKHCGRCSIPAILSDATRDKVQFPTSNLRVSRNAFYVHQVGMTLAGVQRWPMFGLNVFHALNHDAPETNVLRVGDVVHVDAFRSEHELLEFDGGEEARRDAH